jgi:hypothetical protein
VCGSGLCPGSPRYRRRCRAVSDSADMTSSAGVPVNTTRPPIEREARRTLDVGLAVLLDGIEHMRP